MGGSCPTLSSTIRCQSWSRRGRSCSASVRHCGVTLRRDLITCEVTLRREELLTCNSATRLGVWGQRWWSPLQPVGVAASLRRDGEVADALMTAGALTEMIAVAARVVSTAAPMVGTTLLVLSLVAVRALAALLKEG